MSTDRTLLESGYAGVLLCVVGALAWISGAPFVFPSLGPTALVLTRDRETVASARSIVASHTIGVVAGIGPWLTVAQGLTIGSPPPGGSLASALLIGSAVVSVVLTTAGMKLLTVPHPPACATTLIVSLGLLTTPRELLIVVVSVLVLVGTDTLFRRAARRVGRQLHHPEWPSSH